MEPKLEIQCQRPGVMTAQETAVEFCSYEMADMPFPAVKYAESEGNTLSAAQRFVKRTFDIIVAVVALVLFSPFIVLIAFAIWVNDFHNPIFSQCRVGRKGKEFTIYKFRSMRVDSECDGIPRLCEDHDSRLTGIGAFLRNHHLDEFPQLWNVLKGDMSIVGPRPERPYFTEKIIERYPGYTRLFALRPGLFSEATLYNGYTETIEQMVRRAEMDINYLEKYSFSLDVKIIWNTTWSIIGGKKF